MTVFEIVAALSDGGADWASPRAVNAALTNKVGKTITKGDEGKYSKRELQLDDMFSGDGVGGEEAVAIDPDDHPFE